MCDAVFLTESKQQRDNWSLALEKGEYHGTVERMKENNTYIHTFLPLLIYQWFPDQEPTISVNLSNMTLAKRTNVPTSLSLYPYFSL